MLAATGKATAADTAAVRSLAGSTVNLLVAAEGDELGVQDKIGDIKKRFGIDVKMTALAVGPIGQKSVQSVKAPTGAYDAIMVLGFNVAQLVGGGYFDAAQPVPAPRLRPASTSRDFPKGELNYVGYFDVKDGKFGGKTLYLIPGLHGGSVVLFYRKDLFKAAGCGRAQDVGPVPRRRQEAERQRRRREQHDRQVRRRLDVPRRLVHPLRQLGRDR